MRGSGRVSEEKSKVRIKMQKALPDMVREAPEPIPKCQRDLAGSGKMAENSFLEEFLKIMLANQRPMPYNFNS
jgi:hypothetical protein